MTFAQASSLKPKDVLVHEINADLFILEVNIRKKDVWITCRSFGGVTNIFHHSDLPGYKKRERSDHGHVG